MIHGFNKISLNRVAFVMQHHRYSICRWNMLYSKYYNRITVDHSHAITNRHMQQMGYNYHEYLNSEGNAIIER